MTKETIATWGQAFPIHLFCGQAFKKNACLHYFTLTAPPPPTEQKIVELFEEPTEQKDGSVPDDKLSSSLDVVES